MSNKGVLHNFPSNCVEESFEGSGGELIKNGLHIVLKGAVFDLCVTFVAWSFSSTS